MWDNEIREQARQLRKNGTSYQDICKTLGKRIPKGTLAHWCRGIELPEHVLKERRDTQLTHLARARIKAVAINAKARTAMLKELRDINRPLLNVMEVTSVSKIALVMLHLGEGSKTRRGTVCFANSNHAIIELYLRLLRRCYQLDETKFRCTVQCRADQDTEELERYWSGITRIPRNQFYASRIDARSVGKPTLKSDYRGVCVIDYFSADVFNELLQAGDLLCRGR